jgi:hypothetical protein
MDERSRALAMDTPRICAPEHGNMRELSKAECQKGPDHDGKYQQHCHFQPK